MRSARRSTGPRWALAEGEEGGARGTMTFVLVANNSTAMAPCG